MSDIQSYERVRITGELRVISDLHIGSGDLVDRVDQEGGAAEGSYHAILLDYEQCPYLPGSTLRGWLRQYAQQVMPQEGLLESAFGYSNDAQGRRAGRLRVYDAKLLSKATPVVNELNQKVLPKSWSEQRGTYVRHGIALEATTGVVDANKLFHYEVVPAGTTFELTLELDADTKHRRGVDTAELELLSGLLDGWNGSQDSALGGDRGMGFGRLQWCAKRFEKVDKNSVSQWLSGERNSYWELLKVHPVAADFASLPRSIAFILKAEGAMLQHEPDWLEPEAGKPKAVYGRRADGKARITGRTLRGMIRGRASRIAATMLVQQGVDASRAQALADKLLYPFFGGEGKAGCLLVSDAIAEVKQETIRPSIAIDRFLGGVKGGEKGAEAGALWQSQALEQTDWTGDIQLAKQPWLPDVGDNASWWKGLLLLVARDALEGDLAVGSGKGKGLGRFRLVLQSDNGPPIANWKQLRDWLDAEYLGEEKGQDTATMWVQALQGYLEQAVTKQKEDKQ